MPRKKRTPATIAGYDEHGRPIVYAFRSGQRQTGDRRDHPGVLKFRCPWCGREHVHGAVGHDFGYGNGERSPHCFPHDARPAQGRYVLRETNNIDLCGDIEASSNIRRPAA